MPQDCGYIFEAFSVPEKFGSKRMAKNVRSTFETASSERFAGDT
jgi:hypothetical protein